MATQSQRTSTSKYKGGCGLATCRVLLNPKWLREKAVSVAGSGFWNLKPQSYVARSPASRDPLDGVHISKSVLLNPMSADTPPRDKIGLWKSCTSECNIHAQSRSKYNPHLRLTRSQGPARHHDSHQLLNSPLIQGLRHEVGWDNRRSDALQPDHIGILKFFQEQMSDLHVLEM